MFILYKHAFICSGPLMYREGSIWSRISLTHQQGRNPTLLVDPIVLNNSRPFSKYLFYSLSWPYFSPLSNCLLSQCDGESRMHVCVCACVCFFFIVCVANVRGMDVLEISVQRNRTKWHHAKCTHVCSVSKQNYRPNNSIQFAPVEAKITNPVK